MQFRFEKLQVWQDARRFASSIYKVTQSFPNVEKFGLTNQLRRAAVSVALNIAEGSDRKSDIEFVRFLRMSLTSVEEVVTALFISLDQKYISQSIFDKLYSESHMIVAKLNALIRSLSKTEVGSRKSEVSQKGFTLIELLVAVSIIAVLSVVGITTFSGIQAKARDAVRKNDLNTLATALEIYFQKNSGYIWEVTSCQTDPNDPDNALYTNIKDYMSNQQVPTDPSTKQAYCYISDNGGYRLFARLENCSDKDIISGINCQMSEYNFSVVSPDLLLAAAPGSITVTPSPTTSPVTTPTPTPVPTPFSGTYSQGLLVLKYFPTKDGVYLDSTVTGITNGLLSSYKDKVNSLNNNTQVALEEGSTYHKFKNTSATASLDYFVVDTFSYDQAMPLGNPVPWNPGMYRPDYLKILTDHNICDWVVNKGVREVWIWGYHGGQTEPVESNMAGPYGDISNSERTDDMPTCSITYVLYNYNYDRQVGEALHNHGHQIEAVLKNSNFDLFWNQFVGTNGGGRCGWTHNPPNAVNEYDYSNTTSVNSDCEDWKPDGTGQKTSINCSRWGCDHEPFLKWWMQNIPGKGNTLIYNGKQLRNWWDFIGDFDKVMEEGNSLTY